MAFERSCAATASASSGLSTSSPALVLANSAFRFGMILTATTDSSNRPWNSPARASAASDSGDPSNGTTKVIVKRKVQRSQESGRGSSGPVSYEEFNASSGVVQTTKSSSSSRLMMPLMYSASSSGESLTSSSDTGVTWRTSSTTHPRWP